MQPIVRSFITHKIGDIDSDCQDSIYPERTPAREENETPKRKKKPGEKGAAEQCFAVSDGVTTSFFSRLWAQQLTRQFAEQPDKAMDRNGWPAWLSEAQKRWREEVEKCAKAPGASFLTVNGFHGREPAAATFVGLRLHETVGNHVPWDAVALGDSCLFHLRAKGFAVYPPLRAEEFTYLVDGVKSYPEVNASVPKSYSATSPDAPEGTPAAVVEGDILLLATDALSHWLIKRQQAGQPVWGHLLRLENQPQFEEMVSSARREAGDPMVNDDVALLVLRFGAPHEIYRRQRYAIVPPPPPPAATRLAEEPRPPRRIGAKPGLVDFPGTVQAPEPRTQKPRITTSLMVKSMLVLSLLCSFFVLVQWIKAEIKAQKASVQAAKLQQSLTVLQTARAQDKADYDKKIAEHKKLLEAMQPHTPPSHESPVNVVRDKPEHSNTDNLEQNKTAGAGAVEQIPSAVNSGKPLVAGGEKNGTPKPVQVNATEVVGEKKPPEGKKNVDKENPSPSPPSPGAQPNDSGGAP